ncbi:hypothetical protein HDU98_004548 [Podochytrium sp. JEL0797]|nr:hypothetical protein HDU98_004548 [Podochytrium sp. JEL0797]
MQSESLILHISSPSNADSDITRKPESVGELVSNLSERESYDDDESAFCLAMESQAADWNAAITGKFWKTTVLEFIEKLQISWSPDLHINSLLAVAFHARNLTHVSLAGIHTLVEQDLCRVLSFLPDLRTLQLGDLRSTRAAFSSSRELGSFRGTLLALELANSNKNLVSLDLNGMMSLSSPALAGLVIVPPPDNSDPQQPQHPTVSESRTARLTHLGLHSSTSHMDDATLHAVLTNPLSISNITSFAISESHTLSDASFVGIMRALSPTVRVLDLGPGLNLHELAIASIGQLCLGLQSLTCVGMAKCVEVGVFVGAPFEKLETLVLRDMCSMTEVRQLVAPDRNTSGWKRMMDSVVGVDDEFFDALVPEEEPGFTQDMGVQANQADINAELMAVQAGLVLPDANLPVVIGCTALKHLRIEGCPRLAGHAVAKIISALDHTLETAAISASAIDWQSRVKLIGIFPSIKFMETK